MVFICKKNGKKAKITTVNNELGCFVCIRMVKVSPCECQNRYQILSLILRVDLFSQRVCYT